MRVLTLFPLCADSPKLSANGREDFFVDSRPSRPLGEHHEWGAPGVWLAENAEMGGLPARMKNEI